MDLLNPIIVAAKPYSCCFGRDFSESVFSKPSQDPDSDLWNIIRINFNFMLFWPDKIIQVTGVRAKELEFNDYELVVDSYPEEIGCMAILQDKSDPTGHVIK